ncbi:MAG TPA: SDR family NAD(P)-dependent oxidoreductase [Mycobacteriales bacterium]|nr:SDR family NAD(P)-dependent oxidoreductase [Mycobacteriales bacterium]
MDLDGKVAVITGGASGIGLAMARGLAARGCRLVLADVETGALDAAVSELTEHVEVVGVPTDVSDRAAVDGLAAVADQRFGGADIVHLNAGVGISGPTLEMTHDDWRWLIDVNLWGPIHGVEVFLPRLVERGSGHLLFTASFAGLAPNVGAGPYCVTKYGVVALAEVLHKELRDSELGVSVLCPMMLATNIGSADRNRPVELGGTGSSTVDSTDDPNLVGRVLAPEVAAEAAIAAIGTRQLYVFTHEEMRPLVARRFSRIDDAFGQLHEMGRKP